MSEIEEFLILHRHDVNQGEVNEKHFLNLNKLKIEIGTDGKVFVRKPTHPLSQNPTIRVDIDVLRNELRNHWQRVDEYDTSRSINIDTPTLEKILDVRPDMFDGVHIFISDEILKKYHKQLRMS